MIASAQAGDRKALDALLRRHRGDVTAIAHRVLGPDADLEDVVQDALIQICRSLGSFQGRSRFSTWLYRVVSNVARMHIRAMRSRPRLAGEAAQERPRVDAGTAGPEALSGRRQRMARLYALVHALPDKKRTVLLLHDFEGVTPAEIAEIVDAPVMTVRTRLFYARKALYAAMAEEPSLRELVPASKAPTRQAGGTS